MATDDLEQLRKKAEALEEKVKQTEEQRALKKRIKLAQANLRKDTVVAQLFSGIKKKVDNAVNS